MTDDELDEALDAQDDAAQFARAEALKEVMQALKQERSRMTRGNGYTLANVYGMNNAVDIVAKMIGEASGA